IFRICYNTEHSKNYRYLPRFLRRLFRNH
ncbi:Ferrochelatase, partial [Haemophilus influenzae]